MRAISQASFEAATDRWEGLMASTTGDLKAMALDLLAVVDALDGDSRLRNALTDPAGEPERKAGLARAAFGPSLHAEVVELLEGMVRSPWSEADDLAASVGRIAAYAVFGDAERQGTLPEVTEELFSLEQLFTKERGLRDALADPQKTPEQRVQLIRTVLGDKVSEHSRLLLERMVVSPRHKGLLSTLNEHTRIAAERRDRMIAVVTAAQPISDDQIARIERILHDRYGRQVQVQVQIDPEVIGGLRISLGDDVVDGTVQRRLAEVRRQLAH